MAKYYLGLSVTFHDPAVAIVDQNGQIVFAEATERALQNKRALNCAPDQLYTLPDLLADHCPDLQELVIASNWRQRRPWYENAMHALGILNAPGLLKTGFKRLRAPIENYQLHHMMACQRHCTATAGLNLVRIVREHYPRCRLSFKHYDHHLTHAALACHGSPFASAACAVFDSYGEHGAMAFYRYENRRLHRLYEADGFGLASLGFYYMKLTELCGFDWLKGEEWKVMGLAGYGTLDPAFYEALAASIKVQDFECVHPAGTALFRALAHIDQFKSQGAVSFEARANLAFTGQAFFADRISELLRHLHTVTGSDALTLAGGCALNSAYNGQITQRTPFREVHVAPAPADDGCALGAAWLAFHAEQSGPPLPPQRQTPYTGSRISGEALERLVRHNRSLHIEHLPERVCAEAARRLAQGHLIGWIQGRAEFGPRALGNRSILADPRRPDMQAIINSRVKFRESFRPFAPAILDEHGPAYFEHYQLSPYMDKTLTLRPEKRAEIPAVCHVDHTGRLQSVRAEWNPRFHALLSCFYAQTGVPVLLNTSCNIMGKPLVHSLEDVLALFLTTGLDALVIDDYLLSKPSDG